MLFLDGGLCRRGRWNAAAVSSSEGPDHRRA
jgi:hypothetical protein